MVRNVSGGSETTTPQSIPRRRGGCKAFECCSVARGATVSGDAKRSVVSTAEPRFGHCVRATAALDALPFRSRLTASLAAPVVLHTAARVAHGPGGLRVS